MTSTALSVAPHFFWIASRAAGSAALVLSSLSVCLGLVMGTRLVKGRGPGLLATHEALSMATLAAIALHGVSLLGDSYLHPTLGEIAVPFLSSYKTLLTSMGIVAFWALGLLGVSYYARRRIGRQRWRKLHRYTALAWGLGVIHSLAEGTDSGTTWFLVMSAIALVPALTLLAWRHTRPAQPKVRPVTR